MSSQLLREDASLMRGGDNSLPYPREDFERAQPPRRWPVAFPCPVQLSAYFIAVLIGYMMEAAVLGVWWLGVRSQLPMTWLITALVLVFAFLVAAGIASSAGALFKARYGSITALLIVLVGPVLCGIVGLWGGWPIAEHFYLKKQTGMVDVDPTIKPTSFSAGYVHFKSGAYVDKTMVGHDIVYTDVVCAAPIRMPGTNSSDVYYWAFALNCCRTRVISCDFWQLAAAPVKIGNIEVTGGMLYPRKGHPPVHGAIYDAMQRFGLKKQHDLSAVAKIKWRPDPKIEQAQRFAIATSLFICMPLLAPFFGVFLTVFFSPKPTYDTSERKYPLQWKPGPEDPAMR